MKPVLSVEFFPPKTPEGAARLAGIRQELYRIKPQFCSVTYGAGGSTQSGTLNTVSQIQGEGQEAAAHMSCVGATSETVLEQLNQIKALGVKRLVALRGDLPSGFGSSGEFVFAKDLVAFTREHFGQYFHIEVAAYPEMHPQSKSPEADLNAFADKVKAGADSAITQYFFNSDAYFRFVEDAGKLGVRVPIVPGIMPISSSSQLLRFSETCGAEVPRWIRLRLQSYGDDVASIKAFGLEVVTDLCDQLHCAGAPGLHFYTLNQSSAVLSICSNLGWLAPAH
jgi:methylenetetrahydrofolate reductase (NADPH)